MPKKTKLQQRCRSAYAVQRDSCRLVREWNTTIAIFDEVYLGNEKGRTRSYEENRIIVAATGMLIRSYMNLVKEKLMEVKYLIWTRVIDEISLSLHMKRLHVKELVEEFSRSRSVLVFGKENGEASFRGQKSESYNDVRRRLSKDEMAQLVREVDHNHAMGWTITSTLLLNYCKQHFNIEMHKTTMCGYFENLCLSWK